MMQDVPEPLHRLATIQVQTNRSPSCQNAASQDVRSSRPVACVAGWRQSPESPSWLQEDNTLMQLLLTITLVLCAHSQPGVCECQMQYNVPWMRHAGGSRSAA